MVAYRAETAAAATEERLRRDVVKIGLVLGILIVMLLAGLLSITHWSDRRG